MVYVNCFFYGFDIDEEELKKYDFSKNNTLQTSISDNSNIFNKTLKIFNKTLKNFNKALKIHNLTIVNKYRENKILSLSELICNSNLNYSNSINEIIKEGKNNKKKDEEEDSKLTRTMKSYKSVRNLEKLEKIKENENKSESSLLSKNVNYLIDKTSDIILNSIKQVPELIDYYNNY